MDHHSYKNHREFVRAAIEKIKLTLSGGRTTSIALSGGRTPLPVYRALAAESIDWNAIEFWLVDERFVPLIHENSNYRAIREALGEKTKIHGFDTDRQARETIHDYAKTLPEHFDLVLLGIGQDGHTASLFHDMKIIEEVPGKTAQVYAISAGEIPDRATLLPSIILKSKKLIFLAAGEEKKEIVEELLRGAKTASEIPAKQFIGHPDAELLYCPQAE